MSILLLVVCLLLPCMAWSGSVVFNFGGTPETLTTNAKQDDKIARLLTEHNRGRAGANPPLPPLTMEQFNREIYVEKLKELHGMAISVESTDFCTVYQTWTQQQKDQVFALGGNNSPCPQ